MSTGAELIAAERQRQIEVEGWSPEHDNEHGGDALMDAARCYELGTIMGWPWAKEWWKPKTRPQNLVRAGALYLAAIETFERTRRTDQAFPKTDTGSVIARCRSAAERIAIEIEEWLAFAAAAAAASPIGDERLDRWDRLTKAATDGPWSAADEHGLLEGAEPAWCVSRMRPGYDAMSETGGYMYDIAYTTGTNEEADAEFIAMAREALPVLLYEVRARRENPPLYRPWLIKTRGRS